MINITHSVGGISFPLLFITLGLFSNSSIWILLFTIYLGQFMDLDLSKSGISKKFGFRTLGSIIEHYTSGHREETHSLYFCLIITILFTPISIYISYLDGSNIISNFMIMYLGVVSHAVLDMMNLKPIPLFYIPKLNTIGKAKYYSWGNFISNIFDGLSDLVTHRAKKTQTGTLNSLAKKLKKISTNTKFNIGLKVSSEKEFKYVTVPLALLLIVLLGINYQWIYEKILTQSGILTKNILFTIFLLIYSIYGNYFFRDKGGFKDFIVSITQGYVKREDLKKLLRESNFTKILVLLVLILSVLLNYDQFILDWSNTLTTLRIHFSNIGGGNFFEKIVNFFSDILKYFF